MISLEKFTMEDLGRLEEIMDKNLVVAGRKKDWRSFIQWNMDHPDDLYWKIVLRNDPDEDISPWREGLAMGTSEVALMIGYIGYADATTKLTTKDDAEPGDLFMEIYLDPEFTGMGFGEAAYRGSLNLIPKTNNVIFASTYLSNIGAQKFFSNKLGMKYLYFNKRFNAVVYVSSKIYLMNMASGTVVRNDKFDDIISGK